MATQGSVTLGRVTRKHTAGVVGGWLAVSPGSVRNWIKGRALPTPGAQQAMEANPEIGIPIQAWTTPAPDTPPGKARDRPPAEPPVTAREEVARTVAILSRQVREADGDTHASWSHRASLANALTSSLRVLGRLDGSGELSESQVVRSRPFQRAMKAIEGALGAHPAAALAVAKALEGFGQGDGEAT